MVQFLGALLSGNFESAARAPNIKIFYYFIIIFIYGSILLHFEGTDADGAPNNVLKF